MFLLVIPSQALEGQWECNYEKGLSLTLNKSKYYQCPPVLKEFYRLESQKNFTLKIQPIPGGGSGAYYEIPKVEEEVELFNKACLHKCDVCYEEGSDLWDECMYHSISDEVQNNLNKAKKYLAISVIFCIVVALLIIIQKRKEVK